jgi:DNA-binding CsgD family transcriptional regulator
VTARLLERFAQIGSSATPAQPVEPLTEREEEVLLTVVRGRTNEEIARELHISLSTVKSHLASLMGKLGARNRVEIAVWTYETKRVGRESSFRPMAKWPFARCPSASAHSCSSAMTTDTSTLRSSSSRTATADRAGWWIPAGLVGLAALCRRDFAARGDWMTRAYALGMAAGTQVFTHAPAMVFEALRSVGGRVVMMGAGWAINVVVAEWVLRRRADRRRAAAARKREEAPPVGAPDLRRSSETV